MFNRPKIYPTQDESPKTLMSVESVVNLATNEIDRITEEAEKLTAAQFPEKLKNARDLPINVNSARTSGGTIVVGTKAPAYNSNMFPMADEVEEIKLSHEIFQSEEKITEELSQQFQILQKQIEEYRKLYQSAANKLKETQQKLATTEEKLVNTEEDKLQLQEQLRNAPKDNTSSALTQVNRPSKSSEINAQNDAMQKRADELRRALLFENEEDTVINLENILQSKNVWIAIQEYVASLDPFKRDLSLIQSRFGSSVASYFIFTRYLINQTIATATIALGFFIWHIFNLSNAGLGFNRYFDSVGYLPYVMAYSSFSKHEGLLYDCLVLIVLIWTLTSILFKVISEDKLVKTLHAIDIENRNPYSKEVLASWDFSRTSLAEIEEFSGNLGNRLLQELEESKTEGIQKARSRYELFFVYSRRVMGFVSFWITVVASFTAILYVTVYGGNIASFVARAKIPGLTSSNVNALIVPLILNIVNSALPKILIFITEREKWDASSTKNSLMLFRLYLASTLNGLLTVFSYLVLADPMLLGQYRTLRKSFGLEENVSDYSCRMDQVAEGLFTLVGFSWAIDEVMMVLMPFGKYVLAKIRKKEYVKDEFDVADKMVGRLNFMGLIFASFPFCPMTLIFMPWFLIVGFKFEKNVVKYLYVKPERPWQGQKAGLVYSLFYLISFILVGVSVCAYFFSTKTFAKQCSLQDAFVHLCADTVGSIGPNQCTLNPSNDYYQFYRSTAYPSALCERACGPFVNQATNLSPLHAWVTQREPVKIIWDVILVYPYVPWCLVLSIAMILLSLVNTLEVAKYSSVTKERALEAQLLSLEAEKKKQEKLLKKLQSIEVTEDDNDDDNMRISRGKNVSNMSMPFT